MNTQNDKATLVINDGPGADMQQQADCLIEGIGTDREWIAVGYSDEDGFAEVAMLCHPSNAPRFVRAVNEAEAMDAIVRAAKAVMVFSDAHPCECRVVMGLQSTCPFCQVEQALSALAKLREGRE